MTDQPRTITAAGMTGLAIVEPLKPSGPGWVKFAPPPGFEELGAVVDRYIHQVCRLSVISGVVVVEDQHGGPAGPHYHVSVCRLGEGFRPERCDSNDARWVLEQFAMDGAEEDNHVPNGKARNFWRPVAQKDIGRECPCKASEPAIVENKGDFIWRPAP